jgi:gliotoxin/aspirochlorine/mycotoxins biosynthesis cytochrome P450 monooxygenase
MNPSVMQRVHAEIDAALSDESLGSNREDRAGAYIRKTDTLLHYCYLESGRLHPVLFYSLPELTADPKIIHGYHIPSKTSVLIDTYTLNRDAPVWGTDGHVFRPDRFGELLPTQYRYSYWRFGLGPRKCVGLNFGDKIIKTVLMGIMEKYSVEVVDNHLGEDNTKFVHAPAGTMFFTPRQGKV